MSTVTVTINTKSKRAKHLLAIIEEMAKVDSGIEIENFEDELKQSLKEVKSGKTSLLKRRAV